MKQSLTELQTMCDRSHGELRARTALARAFLEREDFNEAAEVLEGSEREIADPTQMVRVKALIGARRIGDAEELLWRLTTVMPQASRLLSVYAELGTAQEKWGTAGNLFRRADNCGAGGRREIGMCRACIGAAGDWQGALYRLKRWIADDDSARQVLGFTLASDGQVDQAEECLSGPSTCSLVGLIGRGMCDEAHGRFGAALEWYKTALSRYPSEPLLAVRCLLVYLSQGDIGTARNHYRIHAERIRLGWGHGSPYRGLAPRWNGEESCGRTILLHCPVGFGDTFLFARFVRYFADRGATVLLECRKSLLSILCSCTGVSRVVERYDDLPSIDFEADLRELFLMVDLPIDSIGYQAPYLDPSRVLISRWRNRLERTLAIQSVAGIVMASSSGTGGKGSYTCKSIPQAVLDGVALCGWTLLSLQPATSQSNRSGEIKQIEAPVIDFGDTASIIRQLECVISVDSAVAHLAGALNARTLVGLPYSAGWRWTGSSSRTQWYQNMSLFRQKRPGEWGPVVAEMIHTMAGRVSVPIQ